MRTMNADAAERRMRHRFGRKNARAVSRGIAAASDTHLVTCKGSVSGTHNLHEETREPCRQPKGVGGDAAVEQNRHRILRPPREEKNGGVSGNGRNSGRGIGTPVTAVRRRCGHVKGSECACVAWLLTRIPQRFAKLRRVKKKKKKQQEKNLKAEMVHNRRTEEASI